MKSMIARLAPLALLLAMVPAHATSTGALLGVFEGNDSDAIEALGLLVVELAKIDTPESVGEGDTLTMDGLTISNFTLKDDDPEILSGTWSYDGTVDIIMLKADGFVAVYEYSPGASEGKFSVDDITMSELNLGNKEFGLSHITAYSVVPVPGALLLFASGLLGLGFMRRS